MDLLQSLGVVVSTLLQALDEYQRRLVVGGLATLPGMTVGTLSKMSGVSPNTIYAGIDEFCKAHGQEVHEALFHEEAAAASQSTNSLVRANPARAMGAPSVEEKYPGFTVQLLSIAAPYMYVEGGIIYVNKSSRKIAEELTKRGKPVSYTTVDNKLNERGMYCKVYRYNAPVKTSVYARISQRFQGNGFQAFVYVTLIVKYGSLGLFLFYHATVLFAISSETKEERVSDAESLHVSHTTPSAEERCSYDSSTMCSNSQSSVNNDVPYPSEVSTDELQARRANDACAQDERGGRNQLALPEGNRDRRIRLAQERHKNPQTSQAIPMPKAKEYLALPEIEKKRAERINRARSRHQVPKPEQTLALPQRKELLALPEIEEKRAKRIENARARHKVEDDKNPIIIPPLYILHEVLTVIGIIVLNLKIIFGKRVPVVKRRKKYIRKKGGGRHKIVEKYPILDLVLYYLIDHYTFGDPEKPTLWCSISMEKLHVALELYGIYVSTTTIRMRLKGMGFSLKRNKKMEQDGEKHPDADSQMKYIKMKLEEYEKNGYCIISIDCKNKEHVGNYDNKRRSYCITAPKVKTHDFGVEKVCPYGVYDVRKNFGFINLGVSSDTAEFAVNSIREWWNEYGCKDYPNLQVLVITADGGGSNSYRGRLFKRELQKFANETNLKIIVHHYPRGKSKYNKIEHRLFCHISNNWRDVTLKSVDIILNRIRSTKTIKGLRVEAKLDTREYKTGIKISKKQLEDYILIARDSFHGEWNYTLYPESKRGEYLRVLKEQKEMCAAA